MPKDKQINMLSQPTKTPDASLVTNCKQTPFSFNSTNRKVIFLDMYHESFKKLCYVNTKIMKNFSQVSGPIIDQRLHLELQMSCFRYMTKTAFHSIFTTYSYID